MLALPVIVALPMWWLDVQAKWIEDRHEVLEYLHLIGNGGPNYPFGSDVDAPWPIAVFDERGIERLHIYDATDVENSEGALP